MIKKFLNKKIKGFTLVETLVAISILSLSILGTFTAVQKGLQSSSYSKDQVIAFYMVQEAMEAIKNIRDQNALGSISSTFSGGAPINWLHGISEVVGDPCYFGKKCTVDTINGITFTECPGGVCPFLKQNPDPTLIDGLFGYTAGWNDSRFKREILLEKVLTDPTAQREILATVTISWTSRTFTKSFQVRQLITNNR